ncbi:UNVERIFIED_CONTAM: hypothetical protein K2H54_075262 [Gekko kuhli]
MLSVQPDTKPKGCAGCNRKIKDRYLLKALDKYWHEDCLKCACCDCRLGEVGSTLYTKANLILCRRDYLRPDYCSVKPVLGLHRFVPRAGDCKTEYSPDNKKRNPVTPFEKKTLARHEQDRAGTLPPFLLPVLRSHKSVDGGRKHNRDPNLLFDQIQPVERYLDEIVRMCF